MKTFDSFSNEAENSFSIIIPFRNEEENLPALLKSISQIDYPYDKFEILLINDDSEDNYKVVLDEFELKHSRINLKILENQRKSNSPKKDAIEIGVKHSNYEWIITTDADCIVPMLWLKSYDNYIQAQNPYFISGPVKFIEGSRFLNAFQILDFNALIGSTIGTFRLGKPIMCNGANLCYRKDVFNELKGFTGNNQIASGDDIFLLEKMYSNYPNKTTFLKSRNAIVATKTEPSLNALIQQRIRWASKSTYYSNSFTKFLGLVVFTVNLLFIFAIVPILFLVQLKFIFSILITLKFCIDFLMIALSSNFLNSKKTLFWFPFVFMMYPFFTVFIGFKSIILKNYRWKNRDFDLKN